MPLGANKAAIMGVAGVSTGDVVLLSTQTASDSASITFSSGIDSTYGEYIFGFYNIDVQTADKHFSFLVNATDTADYDDVVITSTSFSVRHSEDDSITSGPAYETALDLANQVTTSYNGQTIFAGQGNTGADECLSGVMHLFNPSSTTYVKHFIARVTGVRSGNDNTPSAAEFYTAGYLNDTTAIDDIKFAQHSGNLVSGTIKMWGVK